MYVQKEKLQTENAKLIIFAPHVLENQGFILKTALKVVTKWITIKYNFYRKLKQIIVLHTSKV